MKTTYKKQRKMKITSNHDSLLAIEINQLKLQVEQLKNQLGYCLASLNRLGIPTDLDSLETHHKYSCGKHYNC
jgi:hypothetical protein